MGKFALIDFGKLGPPIIEQLESKGHVCEIVIAENVFRKLHQKSSAKFISVHDLFEVSAVPFTEAQLEFFRKNYEWLRRCAQRWIVGEMNHDDFFFDTFKSFCFCCEQLQKHKIKVAFSGTSSPHHLYNFIFYLATVNVGIEHYFLQPIFINNRVNIVEGLRKKIWPISSKFDDHSEIESYVKKLQGLTIRPQYISEYFSFRKNPLGNSRLLSSLVTILKTVKSWAGLLIYRRRLEANSLFPKNKSYSFFYGLKSFKSKKRIANLKKTYNQSITSKLPDRFVLVLGPYQPEATSQPDAEGYSDVRLMLMHLKSRLPPDIHIVYKEHPTMFLYQMLGFDSTIDDHRSQAFYDDIKKMDIIFADNLLDSAGLIEKCEFVIGINGTFALEASIRGKTSFVYANAWYGDLPSVHRINYDYDFDISSLRTGKLKIVMVENILRSLNENSLPNISGIGSLITQEGEVKVFADEFDRILRNK